jgi:hypothetical protein
MNKKANGLIGSSNKVIKMMLGKKSIYFYKEMNKDSI